MRINQTLDWKDLYSDWKIAISAFPELRWPQYRKSIRIYEPKYGQVYHHNWVSKAAEEADIQADIKALASVWPEVGQGWSKGTIKTAELLIKCKTEEEFAAIWICAFARTVSRYGAAHAWEIEQASCEMFACEYGYWHSSSRNLLPELYIPVELFRKKHELSTSTIVELAAINASLVMAHFTPVEYKICDDE